MQKNNREDTAGEEKVCIYIQMAQEMEIKRGKERE